jgi:hypothetical protein
MGATGGVMMHTRGSGDGDRRGGEVAKELLHDVQRVVGAVGGSGGSEADEGLSGDDLGRLLAAFGVGVALGRRHALEKSAAERRRIRPGEDVGVFARTLLQLHVDV